MTVINGTRLLAADPIKDMLTTKERFRGVSYGLAEAGYDIRIAQTVRFVPPDPIRYAQLIQMLQTAPQPVSAAYLETMKEDMRKAFSGYTEVFHGDGTVTRKRGRFALVSSMESFQVPHDMVGIVHDKSTHVRNTVSVFNTVIEPGWGPAADRPDEGCYLTIEMVFHEADKEITIEAGTGIAQVIWTRLEEEAAYTGKYTGQANRPVGAVYEKG